MEDSSSKSYNDKTMQIEAYNTHQSSSSQIRIENNDPSVAKSISRMGKLTDPELRRKKRIAGYNAYAVEGKVKGSIRKSFRWIKDKCSKMVHGFRSWPDLTWRNSYRMLHCVFVVKFGLLACTANEKSCKMGFVNLMLECWWFAWCLWFLKVKLFNIFKSSGNIKYLLKL